MKIYFCFGFLLCLCACAGHDPYKPLASNDLYYCDNGEQMVLAMADKAESAAILFSGRTITLERIDSRVRGDAFSDSIYTLFYDDGIAVVEREGIPVLTGCRAGY